MGWFDEGTKRQRRRRILLAAVVVWIASATYARFKPLPAGLSVASPAVAVPADQIRLLADLTGVSEGGVPFGNQEIFDEVLALIRGAQRFVVLDFFLFNQYRGAEGRSQRDLTGELLAALLEKRRAAPSVAVIFITDPINTAYGGDRSPELEQLRQAGVTVVTTNLRKLRDPNPLYAGLWRLTARWFGNRPGGRLLPHPFASGQRVSVRSWLSLLNFKANHRKVVVADRGQNVVSLVTSFNPHTASSAHTNLAVEFVNGPWRELLSSEQAVAAFSGQPFDVATGGLGAGVAPADTATSTPTVQVVSEGKIAESLQAALQTAGSGDTVYLGMFYLADRKVVAAIQGAARRGALTKVILDPNRDAFGRRKDGLPNRPVGAELMLRSSSRLLVRWYDTHGEQAHLKLLLVRRASGPSTLITGSANFTKRNLRDLNLETDVVVTGPPETPAFRRAEQLFEQLWSNTGGRYTTEYATYRDESFLRHLRYRFMEWSGLSSW